MLELQRTAGNRAVRSLLEGETAQRQILDPDLEDDVIEMEAEKRRNRLLNERLLSQTGGKIRRDDPRLAMLEAHLLPSTAGKRATEEAQELTGMPDKLSSTVDRELLEGLLTTKSELGPHGRFAATAGKRATEEAKTTAPSSKPEATESMEQVLWARTAAGGDQGRATTILRLFRGWPDLAFKAFLTLNGSDDAKLAFAGLHLEKLKPNFDSSEFDLLYTRQADIPTIEKLLASKAWTLATVKSLLVGPAAALSTARQSKFLGICADRTWTAKDATDLLTGLVPTCAEAICDTEALHAGIEGLKATWTMSGVNGVIRPFWAKNPDTVVTTKFLTLCAEGKFASADAGRLVAGLTDKVLKGISTHDELRTQFKAVMTVWTNFAEAASVLSDLANKVNPALTAKILKLCAEGPFASADADKLVKGLAAAILTGIANTSDLQTQLKALKATWVNFAETAVILTLFHTKKPDFAVMAKFLKGCATHTWTQPNAKKLVNGLTEPPLTELSNTDDLQQKVQDISGAWADFAKIAQVIEEAHRLPERMSAADKAEFLKLCNDDGYLVDPAKSFVTTARQAAGYTWAQRFAQVRLFRGHAQPASGTNDLGGAWSELGRSTNPCHHGGPHPYHGWTLVVGNRENKVTHFKDGHSYEAFWFDVGNCHRYGGISSMWPPGTDIGARAGAATATGMSKMKAAAGLGPGGTQDNKANYTIAYAYDGDDQTTHPWTYYVAVSQLYPKGAWVHHELKGYLAEGIGRLKGYIV